MPTGHERVQLNTSLFPEQLYPPLKPSLLMAQALDAKNKYKKKQIKKQR